MTPETFTLVDSDGASHVYVVTPTPAMDALALLTSLVRVGVGPMVRFLQGSWMATPEAAAAAEEPDASVKFREIIAAIDVDKATESFSEGLCRVGGLEKLSPLILAHTTRDGVRLNPKTIDQLYTGNLTELLQVIQRVWDFNGFFGALSTLINR